MKEINKPMSIVRQEFVEQLVNDVNNCQLPLFVIESILQDLLGMVKSAAQKQYEADVAQYEAQLLANHAKKADSNK